MNIPKRDDNDFTTLFTPFTLAGKPLRNRITHASMSLVATPQGRVTDSMIQYHANRAQGGAAMTVTEPLAVMRHQAGIPRPQIWRRDDADALKRFADAVEGQDCRLLGQIQDAGRGRHYPGRNPEAVGASALPDDLSWTVPRALPAPEIRDIIAQTAESARHLQECGFSGVEISCGHGHLFHQFLSPWANRRDDEYGGDWDRRTRIVTELVAALRDACGAGFIIGLKLPGDDGIPGSIGPAEAAIIGDLVTRARNVDYVSFAGGAHARTLEMHTPDRHGPPMPYMHFIRELRHHLNDVPLMALGRITDPAEADGILARGEASLIALGRPLVADPAWPNKAAAGRTWDIRYCLSCNTCWGAIVMMRVPIACVNNPRVSRPDEVDYWPEPLPEADRQRVVVVGAGLAGMEAARRTAYSGHHVMLFERRSQLGGQMLLARQMPGRREIGDIVPWYERQLSKMGVEVHLNTEVTESMLKDLSPDVVILGTGSAPVVPQDMMDVVMNAEDIDIMMLDDLVEHQLEVGENVLVVGGDQNGMVIADYLAQGERRVVVAEALNHFGGKLAAHDRWYLLNRQNAKNVRRIKNVHHIQLTPDMRSVTLLGDGAPDTLSGIDTIVFASDRRSERSLVEVAESLGASTYIVGDAHDISSENAGTIFNNIAHAYDTARQI